MAFGDLYKFNSSVLVEIPNDHPVKTIFYYEFPAERIDVNVSVILTPPLPPSVPTVPQIVISERHVTLELKPDGIFTPSPNECGSEGDHKQALPGQAEIILVGPREFDFRGIDDPTQRRVYVNVIAKYSVGLGPIYGYGFIRGRSWG